MPNPDAPRASRTNERTKAKMDPAKVAQLVSGMTPSAAPPVNTAGTALDAGNRGAHPAAKRGKSTTKAAQEPAQDAAPHRDHTGELDALRAAAGKEAAAEKPQATASADAPTGDEKKTTGGKRDRSYYEQQVKLAAGRGDLEYSNEALAEMDDETVARIGATAKKLNSQFLEIQRLRKVPDTHQQDTQEIDGGQDRQSISDTDSTDAISKAIQQAEETGDSALAGALRAIQETRSSQEAATTQRQSELESRLERLETERRMAADHSVSLVRNDLGEQFPEIADDDEFRRVAAVAASLADADPHINSLEDAMQAAARALYPHRLASAKTSTTRSRANSAPVRPGTSPPTRAEPKSDREKRAEAAQRLKDGKPLIGLGGVLRSVGYKSRRTKKTP